MDPQSVVLPEFVPRHCYEHILHNHSALGLKAALLFRPRTVVISVPYWPEPRPAAQMWGFASQPPRTDSSPKI